MGIDAPDHLTVEFQDEAQHPVCRRMLRSKIDREIAECSFGHARLVSLLVSSVKLPVSSPVPWMRPIGDILCRTGKRTNEHSPAICRRSFSSRGCTCNRHNRPTSRARLLRAFPRA